MNFIKGFNYTAHGSCLYKGIHVYSFGERPLKLFFIPCDSDDGGIGVQVGGGHGCAESMLENQRKRGRAAERPATQSQ